MSTPAPGPAPPVPPPRKVYTTKHSVKMAKSLRKSGLSGLISVIEKCETLCAPEVRNSRILEMGDYEQTSKVLLYQIDPPMMDAILTNTLPSKVASGELRLKPWAKIDTTRKKDTIPGIYVNYLAKNNGQGFTPDEYQSFVDGMMNTINDRANMRTLVDEQYRLHTGNASKSLITETGDRKLRSYGTDFRRIHRTILEDARAQNCTEIPILGEVGWADKIHARVSQHHKMVQSPDLFRIANCVLRVLFGADNIKIHSFCLFRALTYTHAEVGESIGSHLATSYSKYGGWNYDQAGKSVNSAKKTTSMEWLEICGANRSLIDFIKLNMERERVLWDSRLKEAEEESLLHQKHKALCTISQECAQLSLDIEAGALDDVIDSCEDKVETIEKKVRQEASDADGPRAALQDLFHQCCVVAPFSQHTQV